MQDRSSGKIFARFEYEFEEEQLRLEENGAIREILRTYTSSTREFAIKPQPKLYISYNLQAYESDPNLFDLVATISNLGEGIAEGVYINPPVLPETDYKFILIGGVSTKATNLRDGVVALGSIAPGETEKVYFELRRVEITEPPIGTKQSLGKLAEMPAMPVKSMIAGNIVVAPMKMEAVNTLRAHENFLAIDKEIEDLKENIEKLVDKTVSELARSLLDQYELTRNIAGASGITRVYEMTSSIVNIMGMVKTMYELPGKLRETLKSADLDLLEKLDGKSLSLSEYKAMASAQQAFQGFGGQLFSTIA